MNAVWIKNLLLNNPRLCCFVGDFLHLVQHFSAQAHLHIANPCQVQVSKDIGSSGQKFQKGIPCLLSFDGNTGWLSRLVIPQWDRAAHGIDVIDYRREESGVVFVLVVFQDPLHRCVDNLIWREKNASFFTGSFLGFAIFLSALLLVSQAGTGSGTGTGTSGPGGCPPGGVCPFPPFRPGPRLDADARASSSIHGSPVSELYHSRQGAPYWPYHQVAPSCHQSDMANRSCSVAKNSDQNWVPNVMMLLL